jgi:hypothetical protein
MGIRRSQMLAIAPVTSWRGIAVREWREVLDVRVGVLLSDMGNGMGETVLKVFHILVLSPDGTCNWRVMSISDAGDARLIEVGDMWIRNKTRVRQAGGRAAARAVKDIVANGGRAVHCRLYPVL